MQSSGPDSLNSWIISFACCFINMMMYGMSRLSGVLFVASTSRFNINRKKASLPYTFASFMRNLSGPLVGFLGNRYGVRPVTTIGCLLGAIGAGSCFFAENINTVTILWGGIFGLGYGLGNILLPVSINQYFDRHRATASGISFSGACLGSFVLPPVVEILLNTYGLSGTYLFLSGFILNCVPAALLLRTPRFGTSCKPHGSKQSETQSITSGMTVKLYTAENDCQKFRALPNIEQSEIIVKPVLEEKKIEEYNSDLTYDEKMKRLSTQTLLSEYSIRMSITEPFDVEQVIKNSKGKRTVDPKVHETETLSSSSSNTDQDINSENTNKFTKGARSVSIEYEKPLNVMERSKTFSSEYKEENGCTKNEAYLNYGYQKDLETALTDYELNISPKIFVPKHIPTNSHTWSQNNVKACVNFSLVGNNKDFRLLTGEYDPSTKPRNDSKIVNYSDLDSSKLKQELTPEKKVSTPRKRSPLGSFSVIFEPMFILIAVTNGIYCFTFVCMFTIIVDFSRDLEIGTSNEKYVLMCLSVGDLIGRAGLGWITDRRYMTTTGFAALCFACQGIVTAALVWSSGFYTLMILVTLYGLSEASIIVIYPIIIAQYIDQDKQTVAIPSSNFLSGPFCLAVAPLIGYFRDETGSYDYIFYGIAMLSFACCIALLLAPYVAKCQKKYQCQPK